jgi:hypothetical protein
MTFLHFLRTRENTELSYALAFALITSAGLLSAVISSNYKWQLAALNLCIAAFALLQLIRELDYLYWLYRDEQLKKDDPSER